MVAELQAFTREVKACMICQAKFFHHQPRPVFQVAQSSRVLIVGQAPGKRVHETGVPWNDTSGNTLREWMDLERDQFYDPDLFAIIPAALCYPGSESGKGDLPPPPICAPTWHPRFHEYIKPGLTLLIGSYAQNYYLKTKQPVSKIVAQWRHHLRRGYFPLPHPSPRNRKWIRERPWFMNEVIPALREQLRVHLSSSYPDAPLTPRIVAA